MLSFSDREEEEFLSILVSLIILLYVSLKHINKCQNQEVCHGILPDGLNVMIIYIK